MFEFFKKKPKKDVELTPIARLELVEAQINKLKTTTARLEAEIMDLVVSIETLRNKVLRKIQKKVEEAPEEEAPDGLPRTKALNTLSPFS